jgi:uncharacterized spore protein YtfJ
VDVSYTDIRKALDQIDLFILIEKLKLFGFSTSLCKIQSISEGTFGGGNLRGPNIQPIATTLIY